MISTRFVLVCLTFIASVAKTFGNLEELKLAGHLFLKDFSFHSVVSLLSFNCLYFLFFLFFEFPDFWLLLFLYKVNPKAAESLADPEEYPNLFEDWQITLDVESNLALKRYLEFSHWPITHYFTFFSFYAVLIEIYLHLLF